jgi:2-polyprenyl-3-methyl-5-hydroxy-6-metoxy-1,4-benzoquinol methylase
MRVSALFNHSHVKSSMNFTKIREYISLLGLEINYALDSGVSIGGLNISRSRHPFSKRSSVALARCLSLNPKKVLDVGSGGGEHALAFKNNGADVTCIDFGTSIYAKSSVNDGTLNIVNIDFQAWNNENLYEIVWASHVLEHQRNSGTFIEKLIDCCNPSGKVVITVPAPHRRLWGAFVIMDPGPTRLQYCSLRH